jgi:SAM-dependent methyltransferase
MLKPALSLAKLALDAFTIKNRNDAATLDRLHRLGGKLAELTGDVFKAWFARWFREQMNPAAAKFDAGFYPHIVTYYADFPRTHVREFIERGFFSSLFLKGARTLELCCGDGYFTKNYFAPLSAEVLAVDFSEEAIRLAQLNFCGANIEYRVADIRTDFPDGKWDNVIWDGAIEYFTRPEARRVLGSIKEHLADGGVFSGCVMFDCEDARTNLERGRIKFYLRDEVELVDFLGCEYVVHVTRRSNVYPRVNCYFSCSQQPLPQVFVSHQAITSSMESEDAATPP